MNQARGLFGIDLNKKGLNPEQDEKDPKKVPEAVGIVPATIFLVCITFCQLLYANTPERLAEYSSALSTITFMVLLGFADDVLNLRWRYKMVLPPIASLSLLLAYAGSTTVVVPLPLRPWLGSTVDLGLLYLLYMTLLTTFCSNAINIYAGLNGLEAGQSLVIGVAVLVHNLLEMDSQFYRQHLFSSMIVIPFIATTLALLKYNWYPSQVFVGDTYTYFAGVTFAVSGILGHFSKTLLLFFIPQIINFVYSIPQLIGIVPCPRHRLPKLNVKTGKLEGVKSHMNLVNLVLLIIGPKDEKTLCTILLIFQVFCCMFGFFIRYHVSKWFY
eukprot:TRINITY_DN3491_c0_g1_i6.p1 TRINITY_DN3491_c0_g1~~TRINITY_DN3491_c0_g1_i6.p1  ORF type:complete len:328 (-),score=106.04 TRINITY_DN3491_c0_g1_i6:34-1017(-)